MKRTTFLLLAVLFLLCVRPLAAQQRFTPKTIQFKGAPEYSTEELLAASGLKKGTSIAYSEVKGHSQKLLDSGLFESASFTYNGVDLVFTLAPTTLLYPVRLENLPLTPGKELDAALHDRSPLYHGKVPADGGLTEQVRQALEEILAAKGFKASVAVAPLTDLKTVQVVAMNYSITATQVQVGEIHLEGVSPDLLAKLRPIADRAMMRGFNTEHSAADIEETFTQFYADQGFPAVKVHVTQSGEPVLNGEIIKVPFNVTIEEGKHYKLGSIYQPDGEVLTLTAINKAAGVASNATERMSISGGLTLPRALSFVTGQCKSKGYMDCVATPHPLYDDANGIVNYKLEVDPGPVYTMGNLTIQNGADDLRAAMLAAWKLPVGAVFSEDAIRSYYSSQGNTPLGRTFAATTCSFKLYTNHETHTVDVVLRLEKLH
jgi:outer membrane protein assembly factor BamA